VKASRLALLGIVMMLGILVQGLTIPTVDHSPPINAGCLADVVSEDGAFALQNGAITKVFATSHPVFMGGDGPR
jgi:hypothetical protein